MDIPRNWRLQHQRYRMQGGVCQDCQHKMFPPRLVCPQCRQRKVEPFQFCGRGTIFSFTTLYQAAKAFEHNIPYTVALIDLDEGVRITAQLTDVDPQEVTIGMPVEMVVRKLSEEGERGLISYGYKFRPPLQEV